MYILDKIKTIEKLNNCSVVFDDEPSWLNINENPNYKIDTLLIVYSFAQNAYILVSHNNDNFEFSIFRIKENTSNVGSRYIIDDSSLIKLNIPNTFQYLDDKVINILENIIKEYNN